MLSSRCVNSSAGYGSPPQLLQLLHHHRPQSTPEVALDLAGELLPESLAISAKAWGRGVRLIFSGQEVQLPGELHE
eukprot:2039696-Heterocapsa_arctica.AAC.1